MSRFKGTPGPWSWCAGYDKDAPIDIATYKSPGYYDNPVLMARGLAHGCPDVIGGSEYWSLGGRDDAEERANARAIAAVPQLIEALEEAEQKFNVFATQARRIHAAELIASSVTALSSVRAALDAATKEE